jgi:small conductance mechanosensitive channel
MPLLERLRDAFDPEPVTAAVALWLPNVVVAGLTALAFFALNRAVGRSVRFVMARSGVDATATSFAETVLRYLVFTVATVTVLGQVGVDVTGILASLGVLGLTIGFAARDALSNIISGLFIFWDRPFVIGDLVEIGGTYGEVVNITMRSTRVVTPDGRMLAIPNSVVVNTTVASYTNFPHLRLDVDVTVGVNEDLNRVRSLLLGVVAGDPAYEADHPPRVVVTALGDYNNTVQLQAWLDDEKDHVRARFALREAAYIALRDAGIDMPLETLALAPVELRGPAPTPPGASS